MSISPELSEIECLTDKGFDANLERVDPKGQAHRLVTRAYQSLSFVLALSPGLI
jgi:hypothetical protein